MEAAASATLGQRLYVARGRAKLSTKEAANGVGLRKDLIEAVEVEVDVTESFAPFVLECWVFARFGRDGRDKTTHSTPGWPFARPRRGLLSPYCWWSLAKAFRNSSLLGSSGNQLVLRGAFVDVGSAELVRMAILQFR